ncbi:MAG: hypothetical protein E6R09_00710 [Rhodocyclaceae bacterium]|nr:MAG: hypothetical protein E6R09_00710 [Rhodocyclaceae bacterium]
MTCITPPLLAEAIFEFERMCTQSQLRLGDEIFAQQPTLLGAILVLKRFGANDAQIGIALHVLCVAWLAMKRYEVQKGLKWPVISERVFGQCMQRLTARANFIEGLTSDLQHQAVKQQTDAHEERYLIAFALGHLRDNGVLNIQNEAEKQVVLSTLCIVECIAVSAPHKGH